MDDTNAVINLDASKARRLAQYEVISDVARLPFVRFYSALDTSTHTNVIIRVRRRNTESARELVRSGSGFLTLVSQERTDYGYIEVFENFQGTTLEQRCASPVSCESSLKIVDEIARILDIVHQSSRVVGVLHPSLILVDENDNVRLLDPGVSHGRTLLLEEPLTAEDILEILPFISPEMLRGDAVDTRSDQHQLALIACQLFLGKTPFICESPVETMLQIGFGVRNEPHLDVSAAVGECLRRALSPTPVGRYGTCADFSTALARTRRRTPSSPTRLLERSVPDAEPVARVALGNELSHGLVDSNEKSHLLPRKAYLIGAVVALVLIVGGVFFVMSRNQPMTKPVVKSEPSGSGPPQDEELLRALKNPAATSANTSSAENSNAAKNTSEPNVAASDSQPMDSRAQSHESSGTVIKKKATSTTLPKSAGKKKQPADVDIKPIEPTVVDSH